MRDAGGLRKEPRRLFLEAELHGQSERPDRIRFRARQLSDDAAIIEAAETRLDEERADHERKLLRLARILHFAV
jgi:hypothetical protein